MIKIAIVGCTGKLGSAIMKSALKNNNVEVSYAIARKGNQFVGKRISEIIGGNSDLIIIDDIEGSVENLKTLNAGLPFASYPLINESTTSPPQ